jgi:hypothetical protein
LRYEGDFEKTGERRNIQFYIRLKCNVKENREYVDIFCRTAAGRRMGAAANLPDTPGRIPHNLSLRSRFV